MRFNGKDVHSMKKIFSSTSVRVAVVSMILFSVVCLIFFQLRRNDLDNQVTLLRNRIDEMNEVIYSLEAELARPFDEEYVAEIAHKQLGLCYPQEIIFVSGD